MEYAAFDGWTVLREKLKKITIQDLSVVFICASVIYLLRARDSYSLRPVWRKDINTDHFTNGKYPGAHERLVAPIVTDLESDSETEILIITTDRQLQVLTAPLDLKHTDYRLPYLTVKKAATLPVSKDGVVRRPVVMETGFIEAYNETDTSQMRTQVIVVVLENMEVLCFNSDLHLLWQTTFELPADFIGQEVKAMAILVTSHKVEEQNTGSVYVGYSYIIHGRERKRVLEKASPFIVFCLNGLTGEQQWQNIPLSGSMRSTNSDTKHIHWTKLSSQFFSQMPHTWKDVDDTNMNVLNMEQTTRDKHTGVPLLQPLQDIIGLDAHHIEGLPFGGMRPHSDHEHVKHPDTLVIHNSEGIQLLELNTGRMVSRLMLREGKSVYADLADEHELIKVHTHSDHCQAKADYYHPYTKTKFSGPMCSSISTSLWLQSAMGVHRDLREDDSLALTPQLVPSVAKRSGLVNNVMGHALRSEIKGYDSLFLTSSGRLTSYGPSGHVHWQVLLSATWAEYGMHNTLSAHGYENDEQVSVYRHAFTPSMAPFSLKVFAKKKLLLVFGWDEAALVDLYDGYKLAEHSLPCPPLHQPIIQDFNSDGINDVIIVCQFGYIGLCIEKQANLLYTAVTAVVVVLTLLLLSCFCRPSYDEDEITPFVHHRAD